MCEEHKLSVAIGVGPIEQHHGSYGTMAQHPALRRPREALEVPHVDAERAPLLPLAGSKSQSAPAYRGSSSADGAFTDCARH